MNYTCKDCRYFLPVDAFMGMCKMNKEKILPDDASCAQAEKIAKCKFCTNYSENRDYLGKCMEISLAYPDMIAAKCADFKWLGQN
ncbi:MAG: 4-hydroxyphenylacetate decarboxylase small subunit [Bacteroidota bacterium]